MKVLHTIPYFNKASGGPTSCTYQLVKGLVENGLNCDILSFRPKEGDILADDDFIHYLADDRKTPLWFSKNLSNELSGNINCYDLVHINTIWTWPSHIAVTRAKVAGLPIIISPHGMLYPQALKVSSWKKKIIANWYVNRDLKTANCIHATSVEEAKHIREYGLTNPIAIIPNCLDVSKYPQPRTTLNPIRRFGFTGRLNPIKNIDILLSAWDLLGTQTKNAELIIIGDGEPSYVRSLKNYTEQRQMTNVRFTGFLSGATLRDTVRSLDFQVLPSKSENFGMVVPEALICGVPVIATKGTPWQSLEERECGWWIEPTADSLAKTISNAIAISEDNRQKMGDAGRKLVIEKYSSDAVAQQMKRLYCWILNSEDKPSFVI